MKNKRKATYTVTLRKTVKVPEFAFDEIQRLILKHLSVEKVTRRRVRS